MEKQQSVLALQRHLHERVRQRIFQLIGTVSTEMAGYEQTFIDSLPAQGRSCSLNDLRAKLHSSRLTLHGDFHSLPANQEHFLELLQYLITSGKPGRDLLVGLECFAWQDQALLDAFLKGELSEKSLYQESSFAKKWGFPWDPIKNILLFAKARGIALLGLNCKGAANQSLQQRDVLFAQHIARAIKHQPDRQMLCLLGEHHLSPRHLPYQLQLLLPQIVEPPYFLGLLYNTDKYYFQALEQEDSFLPPSLALAAGYYCVLNTPPWGKWLTYYMWQEHVLLHPNCEACRKPWELSQDEGCFYDGEELLSECVEAYARYIAPEQAYAQRRPLWERMVSLGTVAEDWPLSAQPWSYKFFVKSGAYFQWQNGLLYWQPLAIRSLISALAQCLLAARLSPTFTTASPKELFFHHLQLSVAYHSLESIYNPLGSLLQHPWLLSGLALTEAMGVSTAPLEGLGQEAGADFLQCFSLGQALSQLLRRFDRKEGKDPYEHLHTLFTDGMIFAPPRPPLLTALIAS